MEAVARKLATPAAAAGDRRFYEELVDSLVVAAGLKTVFRSQKWSDLSGRWLADHSNSSSTKYAYTAAVKSFTAFLKTDVDVSAITFEQISDWRTRLLEEGRAATTVRGIVKVIRMILEQAQQLGYTERNPAKLVKIAAESVSIEREPYSKEDLKRLVEYLDSTGLGEWHTAVMFGLCLGLRLRDACQRRWDEIDNGVLSFVPGKKKAEGKVVRLPIVGDLAKRLAVLPREGEWITPVLRSKTLRPGGSQSKQFGVILGRAQIGREKREAKGKAGKGLSSKTFHSLRHTTATWLAEAGVEPRIRRLICDHEDAGVHDRYTHADMETIREALGKVF